LIWLKFLLAPGLDKQLLWCVCFQEAPISATGMYEGSSMTKVSGKLEMLAKMLKILKRDGHRVLIFSQVKRWTFSLCCMKIFSCF